MVDSGVENLNEEVDNLVADDLVHRVIAQVDVRSSNSMIENRRLDPGKPIGDWNRTTLSSDS